MTAPSTTAIVLEKAGEKRTRTNAKRGVRGVVGILAFLLLWQLSAVFELVNPRYMPGSVDVIATLVQSLGLQAFWVAVGQTVTTWLMGLAIAAVAATVVGLIIGLVPFLRRATHTMIEFLRPIPSVALIPLAVLVFGMQREAALLLILYACFWQVLVQVLAGIADTDAVAMQTARSYRFSTLQRTRDVIVPTMYPFLVTGIRLASASALILAITSELVIGVSGMGSQIALAQTSGNSRSMYALIVAAGLLGVALNSLMRLIERKTLSWHPSIRGEVAA